MGQCTTDLEGCNQNTDPITDTKYSAEANGVQGIILYLHILTLPINILYLRCIFDFLDSPFI